MGAEFLLCVLHKPESRLMQNGLERVQCVEVIGDCVVVGLVIVSCQIAGRGSKL